MHDTSPWPPDLADMLTQWPWPIFCAPLTLTQFTLTFQIFLTIRCTTTKPCIVLLLDVQTWQVPWPGDLDLYFALQWLWHILRRCSISPQLCRPRWLSWMRRPTGDQEVAGSTPPPPPPPPPPPQSRQHSFVEIDHEIFSTVILSLPLIQEGQLSVSGERMCTILVNRLED